MVINWNKWLSKLGFIRNNLNPKKLNSEEANFEELGSKELKSNVPIRKIP